MAWLLATIALLLARTCYSRAVTSGGCASAGATGESAARASSTMGLAGFAPPLANASVGEGAGRDFREECVCPVDALAPVDVRHLERGF